jgi:hypothetical protein
MAQCEHEFELSKSTTEVRCTKCINFDDEMELPNLALQLKEAQDDFYATQVSFE